MGAITSLEQRSIAVDPGAEASSSILVRNTGTVVDQFTVEVLGDARAWARVEPGTVNLLPNEESTVVVLFQPPRSYETAAGMVPFGIRVSSREDPAGSVVEEGTVEVGAFTDVRIELIPRKMRGRRQAKGELAVDNLGNHPVPLMIDADDPERSLRFRPAHTDLTLQPGTTTFVGIVVHPERRFLRGPERTHPFQVRVTGAGVPPITADGAMVQEPLLPKWLPLALAALAAAAIALVVLWFTLVKTAIQTSARQAANQQVQAVANTANQAKDRAEQAAVAAGLAPQVESPPKNKEGVPVPAPTTPPGPPGPGAQPTREPIDFRIAVRNAPQANDPNVFTLFPHDFPADATVTISDLVLQNPFGDSGILRLLRVAGNQPAEKGDVLLEEGLNNFRDLDYHFLQPWRFKPGEKLVLAINCQNPPVPNQPPNQPPALSPCNPSASFLGQIERPAAAPASSAPSVPPVSPGPGAPVPGVPPTTGNPATPPPKASPTPATPAPPTT
ncbi:MAG TPA: hypothetical protein VGJ13_09115 [Pseudonocardiaceae bacterium]